MHNSKEDRDDDLGPTLPAERIGSSDYFTKILADCNSGYQRCFECHVLGCFDNQHPARLPGLQRAVLDFHELEYQLRAKIKRLHELNESSMAVTRRHQADAEERQRRMKVLKQAIEANDRAARERREEWDQLDASEQQELGELTAFSDGLQAAWDVLENGKKET